MWGDPRSHTTESCEATAFKQVQACSPDARISTPCLGLDRERGGCRGPTEGRLGAFCASPEGLDFTLEEPGGQQRILRDWRFLLSLCSHRADGRGSHEGAGTVATRDSDGVVLEHGPLGETLDFVEGPAKEVQRLRWGRAPT